MSNRTKNCSEDPNVQDLKREERYLLNLIKNSQKQPNFKPNVFSSRGSNEKNFSCRNASAFSQNSFNFVRPKNCYKSQNVFSNAFVYKPPSVQNVFRPPASTISTNKFCKINKIEKNGVSDVKIVKENAKNGVCNAVKKSNPYVSSKISELYNVATSQMVETRDTNLRLVHKSSIQLDIKSVANTVSSRNPDSTRTIAIKSDKSESVARSVKSNSYSEQRLVSGSAAVTECEDDVQIIEPEIIESNFTCIRHTVIGPHLFAKRKEPFNDVSNKVATRKKTVLNSKYKLINKNSPKPCVLAKKQITPKSSRLVLNASSSAKNRFSSSKKKTLLLKHKIVNETEKLDVNAFSSYKRSKKLVRSRFQVVNKNSPIIEISKKKLIVATSTPLSGNFALSPAFGGLKSSFNNISLIKTKGQKSNKKVGFKRNQPVTKASNSRFRFVREKVSPSNALPLKTYSPIMKRVYKSRRRVINKEVDQMHHVARMIKTKYAIVNRSSQSPALSQRNHVQGTRKYVSKRNSSYQSRNFASKGWKKKHIATKPKRNRFKHPSKATQFLRIDGISYKASKTKLSKTAQRNTPTRYSIDPSGKKLRRLMSKYEKTSVRRNSGGKTYIRKTPDVTERTPVKTLASRALNKSIHRVLTASMKKRTRKTNLSCMFYNRFGRCNRGTECPYVHDPSKIAVCTRFLRGTCKSTNCNFSHEISPGKMAICSFFLMGNCTNEECPFRHETIPTGAALCPDFVKGYCHKGKECLKVHILICPNYIRGKCSDGSACAFPHPAKTKGKMKEVQLENIEVKPKDDSGENDGLLEKVSRYFEHFIKETEGTSEACVSNAAKLRKLPSQPSYIPLTISHKE